MVKAFLAAEIQFHARHDPIAVAVQCAGAAPSRILSTWASVGCTHLKVTILAAFLFGISAMYGLQAQSSSGVEAAVPIPERGGSSLRIKGDVERFMSRCARPRLPMCFRHLPLDTAPRSRSMKSLKAPTRDLSVRSYRVY